MSGTSSKTLGPHYLSTNAHVWLGRFWLTALIILGLDSQQLVAQVRYPTTQYQSYGAILQSADAFPVTPPFQKDSTVPADVNDFRSMSPDSWESPQPGFNSAINPFQSSPNGRAPNARPWMPAQRPTQGGPRIQSTSPKSQRSDSEKLNLHNQDQTQVPDDRFFKPTPNSSVDQNKFRSTSFPLSKQSVAGGETNSEGLKIDSESASPSMPEDIRLPDLQLPGSTNGNQSVSESGQTPSANELNPFPNQAHNGTDQIQGQSGNSNHFQPGLSAPFNPIESSPSPAEGITGSEVALPPNARDRRPLWQRRPVLTPSDAPPIATAPPAFSPNRVAQDNFYQPQSEFGFPADPGSNPNLLLPPHYRPDLGHRQPNPVNRESASNDYGQSFDYEKKHTEYPKLGEILKTGRYFGSATALYLRPAFQANTSMFLNQSGVTETFDFAYKLAPKFQIGFESKFGPGIEFEYWGYNDFSRVSSFTSDGIETATTSAWMRGANQWSRISALNAGETLTARHRMELDVIGASFFKEVKLPKAKINGKFGFQTAHIIHELTAQVTDGVGTQISSLRSRSDVRGFGPQFELEYFRPIGHTKMEFLTTASGSVLFGKQSQVIENTTLGNQSRMKADEFVMTFDFFSGAQYRKMFGENRYWFVRSGMLYQAWLHGGTAVLPQDDFGLRGFAITAGLNR